MEDRSKHSSEGAHGKYSSGQPAAAEGHVLDRYVARPKGGEGDGSGEKSPYYKPQAPEIALPKGGGALKGIDEKFTVNAVNGTSSVQVGLPLSQGRGGFTPALSLSYNSGSGNSEFGLGWSLSLPAIQRKADKKLPEYIDATESDVFLLAGAEDLVPVTDSLGNIVITTVTTSSSVTLKIKRYIPRIEGLFARIEYIWNPVSGESWWRVTTKDNITTYYGLTANSRVTDPEYAYRVYKWLPEVVCDHKGNVQQYFYKAEDTDNVAGLHERNHLNGIAPFANTYLKRVGYCNDTPWFNDTSDIYLPDLPSNTTHFLMEAVLDYGDHSSYSLKTPDQSWDCRHDAFSDFHAGFEMRTYRRCRRVLMFHLFSEPDIPNPNLVRSLDFAYQNDGLSAGDLAETDYITSITQKGYQAKAGGGYDTKSLPPITLTHQPLVWNTELKTVPRKDAENAPQGLTGPYQWTDLWGEGLPGILTEQATGWFYKENLGDGHFTPALQVAQKPSLQGLGNSAQWQDLDADGRRHLVSRDRSMPGYFELDDDQQWQPFRAFPSNANVDWNSPFTKLLDMDGDGRADLLITEDRAWTWYKNEGTEGVKLGGQNPVWLNEEKGPRLILNDDVQRIFLADINGDGLTDLVRIQNGEVCYWPNKGYGNFGAKVAMTDAPIFDRPDDFNPQYITLADISGTGAADLIYLGNNRCTAWINLAGNGWSEAKEINPLPGTEPYSKIAILDFLGNGTGCIVWSSPLPQHAHAPLRYIDLMGGVKPFLMLSYDNGLGKEVSVTYKSSSQYYLEDKAAGKQWATRLPFPVQCVHQITTTDTVSETVYTQSYSYHHGYYDHEEREFRGFGRVEAIDTDGAIFYEDSSTENDLDQAPVLVKTWYHIGAWLREGKLLDKFAQEYYQFEGWDDVTIIADFPTGLNAEELREAHRALKGQALRQEVYALDGSSQESIPYAVTASAYCVKLAQGKFNNRFASFYSYQQQSVAFSCERNAADPRIMHNLTLDVDQYGNVLEQAQVVYPRKHTPSGLPSVVATEQGKMHVSYSQNTFTTDAIDSNHYRLRLPASSKSFELTGLTLSSVLWIPINLLTQIGSATEIDFLDSPGTGAKKRLLSNARIYYRSNDTSHDLVLGDLQSLGLEYKRYQLAFTEKFLDTATGNPYNSYADTTKLDEGKYVDLDSDDNYWLPSGKVNHPTSPETNFYTPEEYVDPWDNVTTIQYWGSYWLVPGRSEDAAGNITEVTAYDWRILAPTALKDPNDNISEISYDTLGLPVAVAAKGKGSEADYLQVLGSTNPIVADSSSDASAQVNFWNATTIAALDTAAATLLGKATWRCIYDLSASPVSVAMIAREEHYTENNNSATVARITYTDGFGRIAMMKARAADDYTSGDPRWIGSGKTVYNNKGKVVLQYEPYFSTTPAYDPALQAASLGVSPRWYYDPLGRVRRTDMPDGTFSYTQWDAWMQKVYDANDTVTNSQWYADTMALPVTSPPAANAATALHNAALRDGAAKAAAHYDTPTVMHLDTLARPFYTIQDDGINAPIESYEVLDVLGNRRSVVDGRGNTSLSYVYNLLKAPVHQNSIDGGDSYMLLDVAGQPLYHWDTDGRETHIEYDDPLRRPTAKWLDGKKLEESVYGEGIGSPGDDKVANLRGQLYQQKNGAGLHEVDAYDFKGVPVSSFIQLLDDHAIADVDWSSSPTLSTEQFSSTISYDALGRLLSQTDPGNNVSYYAYDKGGMLREVDVLPNGAVSKTAYVTDIHYNPKGQREAIWYGNGTKTAYSYDEKSYRLTRLLTTQSSTIYQDLNYYYDAVGNITQIRDDAQQTLFFSGSMVAPVQDFTYDALYRLIKAGGRELISTATLGTDDNWNDSGWQTSHPASNTAVQNYTQDYTYDEVGNILRLKHTASSGGYTRDYNYISHRNRLNYTTIGSNTYFCHHDSRGNIDSLPHIGSINWNGSNELSHQTIGSVEAYYQYSGGQRVRKAVEKTGGIVEERIYLGSFEIYRKYISGVIDVERSTVHVSDGTGRIAMLEVLNPSYNSDGAADQLTRYIYSNHLQSSSLELDATGAIISYEEYHPYGTTAYQAMNAAIGAVAKRYRYTGKERDEESGLYYHGARYYIPWLGRWSAVDPKEGDYPALSGYNYCFNNPVCFTDTDGAAPNDNTSSGGGSNSGENTGGGSGGNKQGDNKDEKKDEKTPQTGKTQVIQVEDENGHIIPMPDNTALPYKQWGTGPEWDPFKGQSQIVTGSHVLSQATGGAATVTETITYRYGFGESAGKLFVAGYKQSIDTDNDVQNVKPLKDAGATATPAPEYKSGTETKVEHSATTRYNTPLYGNVAIKPKSSEVAKNVEEFSKILHTKGITSVHITAGDEDKLTLAALRGILIPQFAKNHIDATLDPGHSALPAGKGAGFWGDFTVRADKGYGWNVTVQRVQQQVSPGTNLPIGPIVPLSGPSSIRFVPNVKGHPKPISNVKWDR